ncbi:hypothetical protein AMTR_s00100p00058060 [Amborella trichopoda]|uniref:Uncharacterized protein n=1 Tax=Amborella trichopoda TaxID=13333 RepID=W1NXP2_AMBTC|nr:hypothetical protein AMTR_s00100p00058060 [Amborella trichopoda]
MAATDNKGGRERERSVAGSLFRERESSERMRELRTVRVLAVGFLERERTGDCRGSKAAEKGGGESKWKERGRREQAKRKGAGPPQSGAEMAERKGEP